MNSNLAAAQAARDLLIEALDDSSAELETLRGLSAAEASVKTDDAVRAFLRRSTPDEREALAGAPDVIPSMPGLLVFRPRT